MRRRIPARGAHCARPRAIGGGPTPRRQRRPAVGAPRAVDGCPCPRAPRPPGARRPALGPKWPRPRGARRGAGRRAPPGLRPPPPSHPRAPRPAPPPRGRCPAGTPWTTGGPACRAGGVTAGWCGEGARRRRSRASRVGGGFRVAAAATCKAPARPRRGRAGGFSFLCRPARAARRAGACCRDLDSRVDLFSSLPAPRAPARPSNAPPTVALITPPPRRPAAPMRARLAAVATRAGAALRGWIGETAAVCGSGWCDVPVGAGRWRGGRWARRSLRPARRVSRREFCLGSRAACWCSRTCDAL